MGGVARPPCLDCPASVAVCGVLYELEVAVVAAVDGHGHVALLQIFLRSIVVCSGFCVHLQLSYDSRCRHCPPKLALAAASARTASVI